MTICVEKVASAVTSLQMGTHLLSKKNGGGAPQSSAHFYCSQTAACIFKMPLGMKVCLRPVDFVLDGDQAPPPKKGTGAEPPFVAHAYCGQTAACMKMPLGT